MVPPQLGTLWVHRSEAPFYKLPFSPRIFLPHDPDLGEQVTTTNAQQLILNPALASSSLPAAQTRSCRTFVFCVPVAQDCRAASTVVQIKCHGKTDHVGSIMPSNRW